MNKHILIGSLMQLKIINEWIHCAGILADEIEMVEEDNNGFIQLRDG